MIHDSFNADNPNQFVISYELLALLRWLAEHDGEKLKKIVAKAMNSGLQEEIQAMKNLADAQLSEDIQQSIVEFFGLLETLLFETSHEQTLQTAAEKKLMPAIDHIDAAVCDNATLRFSIEKAAVKSTKNPDENPQEILFKEILKNWKPQNKKILH